MVRYADTTGLSGSACWVGTSNNSAIYPIPTGHFFRKIPSRGSASQHDLVKHVQRVRIFDRTDARHWIHVEVNAQQQRLNRNILRFR